MIENIRKYTGLMIVVLVLLFIGLVFLGDTAANVAVGKPVASIDGKKYSEKDFRRMALNPLEISDRIGDPRNPFGSMLPDEARKLATRYVGNIIEGNPFLGTRTGLLRYMNITLQGDEPHLFLANRIAVQKAGLDYGATPGPVETEEFIEGVLFAAPDGNFDQAAYSEFLDEKIGSLGIGTRGFNEYVRDLLTAQNLAKLVSGAVSIDRAAARQIFSNQEQKISAQQVILESTDYEGEQNPTEEEIKAYWEENQQKYNTDERRKISYVFIEPDWDAVLLKAENDKKAAETARKAQEDQAKKAEEAAAKANKDAAEKEKITEKPAPTETPVEVPAPTEAPVEVPAPTEAPVENPSEGAEGDIGAQGEPAPKPDQEAPIPALPPVNTTEVPAPVVKSEPQPAPVAKPVAPIIEKSAKDKLSPQQKKAAVDALNKTATDFFDPLVDLSGATYDELAAEQGHKVISTEFFAQSNPPKELDLDALDSPIGKLSDIAFAIDAEAKDDQLISEPYSTPDGWFIGRLDEVEASRPLTYEEAKVKATVDLKKKLARDKLKVEAEATHAKLVAALAEKKSFAEATKDSELEVEELKELAIQASRLGQPNVSPAFDASRYTDPGTIAEIKYLPNDENPERALIIFVEKREITLDDAFNDKLEQFIKSQNNGLRLATFQNWLKDRYTENEAEYMGSTEER